jgi:glucose-1-phosphate adenylyltransferase
VIGTLRAEGSRVLGAVVHRSILARNTLINPGAVLEECIIGQGVTIGENCKLRRVIVDAHNKIPPDTIIGYDLDEDRKKYHVDETSGVVVIGMPVMQLRKDIEIPIPPILER